MIFKSLHPDATISEVPFGTRILEKISTYGDRVALVNGETGKEFTYSQIRNEIIDLSATLTALGVRKGHVIMFVVPLDPDYVPLLFAIATCGAIINFCYSHENPEEMLSHIENLKPFLIVTEYPDLPKSDIPSHVLTLTEIRDPKLTLDLQKRVFPTDVMIDVHNDPFAIFNSSGTTGKSKGIVMTQFAMGAIIDQYLNMPEDQSESKLIVIPRFHYAVMIEIIRWVFHGIKLIISANITVENLYKIVKDHAVNSLGTTDFPVLMKVINGGKVEELRSLRWVGFGGMPFPDHLKLKVKQEFGFPIVSGYGASEVGIISFGPLDNLPVDSVGKLHSNVKVRIMDPLSKAELGVGESGEIVMKSPCMMKEYLNPEGDDRFAIDSEGWFHTGDVGYFDQSGFLYVIDRIKNVIKGVGGISLYPSEMEKIFLEHPHVKDVAVIGIRHPKYSETPKAFVVRRNESADADDILAFYNNQVSEFKKIHGGLEFIEVIPRIGIGKIDRNKLKKLNDKTHPVDVI